VATEVICNDTTLNTDFFCLLMGRVQNTGAAISDRAAAPNGKYNYHTPKCSKVASRYNSRLVLSIITFRT
jgi:hypothetical protein